jgi:hypothetical protein
MCFDVSSMFAPNAYVLRTYCSFDAGAMDPLSHQMLTADSFGDMAQQMMQVWGSSAVASHIFQQRASILAGQGIVHMGSRWAAGVTGA